MSGQWRSEEYRKRYKTDHSTLDTQSLPRSGAYKRLAIICSNIPKMSKKK